MGKHRIQGNPDEFIPSILQLDKLDSIVCVDDAVAIIMTQKLASILEIEVGILSGTIVKIQNKMSADAICSNNFC